MLVMQIIQSKGDKSVVTVPPQTRLAAAAEVLADKGIGTVVVSDDGTHAMGILSERDIVRQIARRGGACLSEAVLQHMTADLKTAALSDDEDQVLTTMTNGRFRHMPVVKDGALVGLITLGDVVKAKLAEVAMEKNALEGMIMGY